MNSNTEQEYNRLTDLNMFGIYRFASSMPDEIQSASTIVHASNHERISDLLSIGSCFEKILCDPNLHSFLKEIYPKGYHCTTYSSNTLRKNVDKRGWHCDYPYHEMDSPYPAQTLGVQVIWTLDDFTLENGATQFIVGSHKARTWPDTRVEMNKISSVITPKGSIVVFLGKLWHTQSVNTTDLPRSALLANFSPRYIKAKDDTTNYPSGSGW